MTCTLEAEMDVAFEASPGWRIVCIGDQHGEIRLMRQLLKRATELKTTAAHTKIVYLGDLIDRGPDSLACLDLAIRSQTKAPPHGGSAGPSISISLALPDGTARSSYTDTIQPTDECHMPV